MNSIYTIVFDKPDVAFDQCRYAYLNELSILKDAYADNLNSARYQHKLNKLRKLYGPQFRCIIDSF